MADSIEQHINVSSIKRIDPYVKDLIATCTHVAVYKFNPAMCEWEKTETEGALFLYSRSGEPLHSIMVMNRLNTNNLIEPIVKEFEYQMKTPFLLYRNAQNNIFGIWFYNKEECVSISYLIGSVIESLKERVPEKFKKKQSSIDIFSMLSKAQEDFNNMTPPKTEISMHPKYSSTPHAPDVTSQSVVDFFAKAGSKSKSASAAMVNESENLLQRLMSNPVHTVEHIEKQQRSVTPQEQVILRKKPQSNADRKSVPASFPSTSINCKGQMLDNFMRNSSPQHNAAHGSSPLAAFLMQSQNLAGGEHEIGSSSPVANILETPQKPALMPPMMFASSSATKDKNDPGAFDVDKIRNVEPLTKNQILQALSYLLRSDPDFVVKLHEAYVKSFAEMVNISSNSHM